MRGLRNDPTGSELSRGDFYEKEEQPFSYHKPTRENDERKCDWGGKAPPGSFGVLLLRPIRVHING